MTTIPAVSMQNSQSIPQIGLGLWKVQDEDQFQAAFKTAIASGYRHFDSAQVYGNEQMLGRAWKKSGLKREQLFLTTKIGVDHFGTKRTPESFQVSLEKLQTDYVDLLLLHFPVPLLRKQAWQALEIIQGGGKARAIGVSNYTVRHLEQMRGYTNIVPAVNQVELHVFLQQPELIAYCDMHNIVIEAYSPLAHAKAGANEPLLEELSAIYGKTYAQIMLRWCIQKGLVVLPKSVTASRVKENINIFDFELSVADMKRIGTLDRNLRTCWNPTLVP